MLLNFLKEHRRTGRRGFLGVGLVLAVTELAQRISFLGRLGTDDASFRSEYTIFLSHEARADGVSRQQFADEIMKSAQSTIDQDWYIQYNILHEEYQKKGLLKNSYRVISPAADKVTYVKIWKNKAAFRQFFNEARVHRLDDAFIAAGLKPELANKGTVFTKS